MASSRAWSRTDKELGVMILDWTSNVGTHHRYQRWILEDPWELTKHTILWKWASPIELHKRTIQRLCLPDTLQITTIERIYPYFATSIFVKGSNYTILSLSSQKREEWSQYQAASTWCAAYADHRSYPLRGPSKWEEHTTILTYRLSFLWFSAVLFMLLESFLILTFKVQMTRGTMIEVRLKISTTNRTSLELTDGERRLFLVVLLFDKNGVILLLDHRGLREWIDDHELQVVWSNGVIGKNRINLRCQGARRIDQIRIRNRNVFTLYG